MTPSPPPDARVPRPRLVPWIVGALAFGLVAKFGLRSWLPAAGLVLAGPLPTLGWTLFMAFAGAWWSSPRLACLVALAANVLYEFDQLRDDGFEDRLLPSSARTFDPVDLAAAFVGAALAYVVLRRQARR